MNIVTGRPFQLTVNGQELNVRIDGPEGAPWMVFSNSLASDFSQWDALVDAFGGRFRFLRYDQRGHGGSAAPAGTFGMEDLADDLLRLMDLCGVENAVLAGVSMGATTALRCAAREPGKCRGVVACDGVWRSVPGAEHVWEERFAVVRKEGMHGMAEPTVRRWFQPEFFEREPETVDRVRAMIAATKAEGYFGCARALLAYDFSADYPRLSVPAFYVAGGEDGDTPAVMKIMANATPGAQYHVIDRCGHLPNVEKPAELFAVMDAFIRGLSAA